MPLDFDNPRDEPTLGLCVTPKRRIKLTGKAAKIAAKAVTEVEVKEDRSFSLRSIARQEITDLIEGKHQMEWRK